MTILLTPDNIYINIRDYLRSTPKKQHAFLEYAWMVRLVNDPKEVTNPKDYWHPTENLVFAYQELSNDTQTWLECYLFDSEDFDEEKKLNHLPKGTKEVFRGEVSLVQALLLEQICTTYWHEIPFTRRYYQDNEIKEAIHMITAPLSLTTFQDFSSF